VVYGVYEGNTLVGGALTLGVHARRGNFISIPYGPIFLSGKEDGFTSLMNTIAQEAEKKGYIFIRVSPFADDTTEHIEQYRSYGFRKAPLHILAEHTRLLDLSPTKDELLMNMNKNHRNLIRRCEREGVRVEMYTDREKLKEFHEMIDFTAKRHNFTRFSDAYVEAEFDAFSDDREVRIFHAYLPNGTLDTAAVIYYFGSMAAYRHGTSLIQNSKLPTSYLLQWYAIQEAKKQGMKYYNFWGIAPEDATKNHPFYGITHFKKDLAVKQSILCPHMTCHYQKNIG